MNRESPTISLDVEKLCRSQETRGLDTHDYYGSTSGAVLNHSKKTEIRNYESTNFSLRMKSDARISGSRSCAHFRDNITNDQTYRYTVSHLSNTSIVLSKHYLTFPYDNDNSDIIVDLHVSPSVRNRLREDEREGSHTRCRVCCT